VVDASEHAVKKGQTHPADLKRLQKDGVVIFSSSSLHAKVFVFGSVAFIGSTNASQRSSRILTEAIVKTPDRAVVRSAKAFVKGLCLDEMGPDRLTKLQKLYRPPQVPGGGGAPFERFRARVAAEIEAEELATIEPDLIGLPPDYAAQIVLQWEMSDPRDAWRHTGEAAPPDIVRNSDITGPQRAKPTPYQTPQATIDAFFFIARTQDAECIADWLAAHPRDAQHLHKLWKQKC
jgi:PLD-like domain